MNDEEILPKNENEVDTDKGDLLSAPEESAQIGDDRSTEKSADNSAVSPDPGTDSDPAVSSPDPQDAESALEQLRGELTALRAELAAKDALFDRLGTECEEFRRLYPNTSLASIPDSVWNDVENGLPVAAAYALAERRRMITELRAAESNRENEKRSAGALTGSENDYFSQAEVRAMSQAEVRANYQKIMRSMQNWH